MKFASIRWPGAAAMALADLLARLEREAGTCGTAAVQDAVPATPAQALECTAGTPGTVPIVQAQRRSAKWESRRVHPHAAAEAVSEAEHVSDQRLSSRTGDEESFADFLVALGVLGDAIGSELVERGCVTCRHRATPGLIRAGYCAMRTDTVPAYGASHPLRRLPPDGGAGCEQYVPLA